jgi:tRNA1Val (adenine37-N6)-methyltransferase
MTKTSPESGDDETLDSFYHGQVRLIQKKMGYRFSVDAPLLADFIETRPGETLLELGAGNGVIFLLLSRRPFLRITALEIQPGLAALARRNVLLNGLAGRIIVLEEDLKAYKPGEAFDVVFSNPPYIRKKGGHLSLSAEKSAAKHEIHCDIFDIMQAASRALKRSGRCYIVYPAARRPDFDRAREAGGLKTRKFRLVHSRAGEAPRWLLAECDFSAVEPSELPPLFVYGEGGAYTPEMERIFRGEAVGAISEQA